ncbi:5-formyltetrahydrofolate cyclo-ligase [Cognatishimia sp. F0-27]|uniref:5-formyltetrahydrofolate cyclo-ligase n=1 Tax=Cognatishimia sp. F0-27 TaxID=2816855 RepID=UPI001D0CAD07|nr:5-formyltetrahydrofolate cyclo-ligase [Cognatishimia sp. F0-27]MCC1493676.1 5-formyltetrahydrofolate cyclo-ligase [Cognatishimia sp. F0-27]
MSADPARTPVDAAKAAARVAALARRAEAHRSRGPDMTGRLAELLAGYRGVPLAGYMPIRSEIDPRPVMADAAAHGPVGVPVITGKAQPLRFALWDPDTEMTTGPFGARVPARPQWMVPEILIVPLVAFTATGARLGYGGGFYDRTLAELRACGPVLAIGFAYAAQQTDALPDDPFDAPLDLIVTEDAVLSPTG